MSTTVAIGDTAKHTACFAQVTPGDAEYSSEKYYNENWAIVKQDSWTNLLVLSTLGSPWTMLVDTNSTNINTRLQILGNISRIFPVELKYISIGIRKSPWLRYYLGGDVEDADVLWELTDWLKDQCINTSVRSISVIL